MAKRTRKAVSTAIADECERLFCGELQRTFSIPRDEVGMCAGLPTVIAASGHDDDDVSEDERGGLDMNTKAMRGGGSTTELPPSPPDSAYSSPANDPAQSFLEQAYALGRIPSMRSNKPTVTHFLELWDYLGGASFRGFIAESPSTSGEKQRSLFLFLPSTPNLELKTSLVALIELATECFECENLVLGIERNVEGVKDLIRDLGWVGFELVTLDQWRPDTERRKGLAEQRVSERWLFVGMEV